MSEPRVPAAVPPNTAVRQGARTLLSWLSLGSFIGVLCGASSALFLWLLDVVTGVRGDHEVIVYALPLAGLLMGLFLERFGRPMLGGTNLVLDAMNDGGPPLPLRMAPLVLLGTVLTHLFGGSAGREGTAVQMGASLADAVAQRVPFALRGPLRGQLVAAGVAGGFGAVFGTPWAGVVFALEVAVIGRLKIDALVPALVAAFVGDLVTRALGIEHTAYPAAPHVALSASLVLSWLLFAACIAGAAALFVELTRGLKLWSERRLVRLPLRLFVGGLVVVVLWCVVGTGTYLGLGLPALVGAFSTPDLGVHVFALKLLFTAVTLSAGFLGGEVTPLFFIGAALGSVLARWLGIPIELGAGVGMAAMFAASANTPLALSVMAVELLGVHALPHVLLVCVLSFLLTGHRGIYGAQRMVRTKRGARLPEPRPVRAAPSPPS